jgi:hypothetical protein
MSAGAPRRDACQASWPRAWESRRSSWAMCRLMRMLRSVRLASSASRDLGLTCGPVGLSAGCAARESNRGVQVWVPVDQAAVHAGAAGDGGDAEVRSVGTQVVERFEDAAPAAGGVVAAGSGQGAGR